MNLTNVEPVIVEGRIRIPYRWPAGKAGGQFLYLLQTEGRLLGLRCPQCNKVTVPPRPRCLACKVGCEDWIPVGPDGVVTTWTRSGPHIFALIQLEGANTALLHTLIETKQPQSGMRVTAVLQKDRHGLITDLAGFRPVR